MKPIIFVFLTILVCLTGCTKDTLLEPTEDQIVVRGYIYAGEPVSDIQITKTLPLGSEETQAPPVNDASVSLVKDGTSYTLVASAGDSGYYHYAGDDLAIEYGDEVEIQVDYVGETVSGKTIVPYPPEEVTASSNELVVPDEFIRGEMNDSTMSLTITWKEDESSLFYVVAECADEDPAEIATFDGGGGMGMRRFVFPPTNNNEYQIHRFSLSYYGNYVAKVYRVNQEYADLYQSRNQDSRDLNEPLTNIENGLGVFSAFASQAVYF